MPAVGGDVSSLSVQSGTQVMQFRVQVLRVQLRGGRDEEGEEGGTRRAEPCSHAAKAGLTEAAAVEGSALCAHQQPKVSVTARRTLAGTHAADAGLTVEVAAVASWRHAQRQLVMRARLCPGLVASRAARTAAACPHAPNPGIMQQTQGSRRRWRQGLHCTKCSSGSRRCRRVHIQSRWRAGLRRGPGAGWLGAAL